MTTERVEEIRRCNHSDVERYGARQGECLMCLRAALAQVERERRGCEGALADAATVPTDDVEAGIRALILERDTARAEVERLKEQTPYPDDPARSVAAMLSRMSPEDKQAFNFCVKSAASQAEADHARTRAVLDEIAKAAITYQPAAKRIERIITIYKRAVLEGRG